MVPYRMSSDFPTFTVRPIFCQKAFTLPQIEPSCNQEQCTHSGQFLSSPYSSGSSGSGCSLAGVSVTGTSSTQGCGGSGWFGTGGNPDGCDMVYHSFPAYCGWFVWAVYVWPEVLGEVM